MDGISEGFADVGTLRIFYGAAGEGQPVICLHGTGPGASGLTNFARNVDALAACYRVVVPDLPRFGRSSKVVVTEPRLDYLSAVIRGFMDALGIDRAHFVGNSMGGQAALKLAIDSPERVGHLVLVAPAPLRHSTFSPMPAEAVRQIAEYYQGDGPSREKMRLLLHSLVYDKAAITEELVDQRYAASVAPDVLAVNRGPHWAVQSLDDQLERATAPTLLVWGIDDRASPSTRRSRCCAGFPMPGCMRSPAAGTQYSSSTRTSSTGSSLTSCPIRIERARPGSTGRPMRQSGEPREGKMDIAAAYACSHTGLMTTRRCQAAAADSDPVFAAFDEVAEQLRDLNPDAIVMIGTDHLQAYSLAQLPAYSIGVGPVAQGKGDAGQSSCSVPVHQQLAQAILGGAIERGFDLCSNTTEVRNAT